MGVWALAAEHNSEKTGTVCECGTLSDEPVVHRIASSGLIVVMPYITVRNTPNSLGTSKTYIDFANASGSSLP